MGGKGMPKRWKWGAGVVEMVISMLKRGYNLKSY
jgi:hypothetical protein